MALELETAKATLLLRELTVDDVDDYFRLVDRNREHLTKHGDYQEEGVATLEWVRSSLTPSADGKRFALWHDGWMVGRADLVAKGQGKFALGYWLGAEFCGQGLMTEALRTLMLYGKDRLGAHEYFAGVTHSNDTSVTLLRRLGFEPVADFDTYTRFRKLA